MTMSDHRSMLGKQVVARTAQGEIYDTGEAIGYTDQPTLTIEKEDGTRFSWIADMCHPIGALTAEDFHFIQSKLAFFRDWGTGSDSRQAANAFIKLEALRHELLD